MEAAIVQCDCDRDRYVTVTARCRISRLVTYVVHAKLYTVPPCYGSRLLVTASATGSATPVLAKPSGSAESLHQPLNDRRQQQLEVQVATDSESELEAQLLTAPLVLAAEHSDSSVGSHRSSHASLKLQHSNSSILCIAQHFEHTMLHWMRQCTKYHTTQIQSDLESRALLGLL
jgi:hypothetical protein